MSSSAGHPWPEARLARIPALDGVRGLAILLVLVWHYGYNQVQTTVGSASAYVMTALSLTWAGVDLFFVLSGFLIGGILLEQRLAPHYFKAFYVRRLCRIAPLYYLVFVVFCVALAVTVVGQPATPWVHKLFGDPMPLWSYALQVQNVAMAERGSHGAEWLSATWSLAVEEQFYIVLPLLIRFVRPGALPAVLAGLVCLAPIYRVSAYLLHQFAGFPGYVMLPGRIDALFIGVLAAWAMRQPSTRGWLARSPGTIRAVVAGAAAVVLALMVTRQGIGSPAMSAIGHTVLAILSVSIILLALMSPEGRTAALLKHPLLVRVGAVSYGVYLLHQPVSGLLHGLLRQQVPRIANLADAMTTLLAVACTFGLAMVSERFFERPIVLAGQRTRYGA